MKWICTSIIGGCITQSLWAQSPTVTASSPNYTLWAIAALSLLLLVLVIAISIQKSWDVADGIQLFIVYGIAFGAEWALMAFANLWIKSPTVLLTASIALPLLTLLSLPSFLKFIEKPSYYKPTKHKGTNPKPNTESVDYLKKLEERRKRDK